MHFIFFTRAVMLYEANLLLLQQNKNH